MQRDRSLRGVCVCYLSCGRVHLSHTAAQTGRNMFALLHAEGKHRNALSSNPLQQERNRKFGGSLRKFEHNNVPCVWGLTGSLVAVKLLSFVTKVQGIV